MWWYLLRVNCQERNNGAEQSWSVTRISHRSDTGPGARPTSGSGSEMSLSVSGLRWVSGVGARHWQMSAETWEAVLPGQGAYCDICAYCFNGHIWKLKRENVWRCVRVINKKNQGKKFGFIWCLDLIENSMRRAESEYLLSWSVPQCVVVWCETKMLIFYCFNSITDIMNLLHQKLCLTIIWSYTAVLKPKPNLLNFSTDLSTDS